MEEQNKEFIFIKTFGYTVAEGFARFLKEYEDKIKEGYSLYNEGRYGPYVEGAATFSATLYKDKEDSYITQDIPIRQLEPVVASVVPYNQMTTPEALHKYAEENNLDVDKRIKNVDRLKQAIKFKEKTK